MMGATGEPSGYYPMDSNGLSVQSAMTAPCVCPVIAPVSGTVCPPLGYGGCEDEDECATVPHDPTPNDNHTIEPLRYGKRCSAWQRWWCHNITCRGHGGMLRCVRVFYCRSVPAVARTHQIWNNCVAYRRR